MTHPHWFLLCSASWLMKYLIWLGVKRWRSKDALISRDAGLVPNVPLFTQYLLLTTTFAVCALISPVKGYVAARAKLFNRTVGDTLVALGLGLLKTRHRLA